MPESAYECPSSHYITPCKTESFQNGADCLHLEKEAVVVLTRLPEHVISALQSSTAQELYSETESFGEAESDTLWEPGEDSDDSDIPLSHNNRKTTKMKKSGASEKSKQTLSINSLSTGKLNNKTVRKMSTTLIKIVISTCFCGIFTNDGEHNLN